jgi:menaquinone-dependent protoporphyrinogen IX oxidase
MSRVLVVYGTKTGCTAGVAEAIGDKLRELGAEVWVLRAEEKPDPTGYDAVIVGSGVRAGLWHASAKQWLVGHAPYLREHPLAMFTTCLTMHTDPGKAETVRGYTELLLDETGLAPVDDAQRIAHAVVDHLQAATDNGTVDATSDLEELAERFVLSSRQLRRIVRKELGVAACLYIAANVLAAVAFVQSLYGKQALGLSFTWVASIPALTAAFNLLAYRAVVRRLSHRPQWKLLAGSAAAYAVLALLLFPCSKVFPLACLALFGMMGGALYLMTVASNSTLNVIMGEDPTGMLSAVQALMLIVSAPFTWLAGKLFDLWPFSSFLAIAAFCLLMACLVWIYMRRNKDTAQEGD